MDKVLDSNKSVYNLCQDDPEIKEIMISLGFDRITEPGNLKTVGRIMTKPKGARMKEIDLGTVIETFRNRVNNWL